MPFIKEEDQRITAVSHSRMNTHERCARRAKYKFILRYNEPASPAMDRGLLRHKAMEFYLGTPDAEPPDFLEPFPRLYEYYEVLRRVEGLKLEHQVAFDDGWGVTEWFSPTVKMRMVFDALYVADGGAVVVDHKTGKIYHDDHDKQSELYALGVFKMHPDVQAVTVAYGYLDAGLLQTKTYLPADEPKLEARVTERMEAVLTDGEFLPNPGKQCRWCHFRKGNGGPCEYGG